MRFDILWDESVNTAVRDAVGPTAPLFEWLTHLGDGAVLLVFGVVIYWFGARTTRQDRAFVIAVGTAALALSAGLKGIIQLPRPELVFTPVNYPGYSFPSAHAMGSAAFYGALAVTMTRGRPIWRYGVAGLLIAIVAMSRVVMGVHFLGDVLIGSLLGLVLVGIGVRYRDEGRFDPGPMFVLATIIAVLAAILGSRVFLSLTIGASVGGTIGWYVVKGRSTTSVGAAVLVIGLGAIIGIIGLRVVSTWVEVSSMLTTYWTPLFIGETIGYTLLTTFVLVVPWLAIKIEDRPIIQYLQRTLPFRGRLFEPTPVDTASDRHSGSLKRQR